MSKMTKKQQAREELYRFTSNISCGVISSQEDGMSYLITRANKVDALILAAKQLRRVYERQCNGYHGFSGLLSSIENDAYAARAELRDERKEERLKETIKGLVADLSGGSLVPVFESDPRGSSVILVKPGTERTWNRYGSGEILTVPDWL